MPFTPEDIAALADALKPVIEQVASKSAADHVTKRNKSFDERFEAFQSQISAKLTPPDEEPEKVTLTTRMNKLEEENKKLRLDLSEEKKQGQVKNMRSSLQEKLSKAGVPAEQMKAVVSLLIHEDRKVVLDKEGNAVFRGEYEDELLPLDEGVQSWLKGEGSAFLPRQNPKGTGARPIRAQQRSIDDAVSEEEADAALIELIRKSQG